MNQPFPAQPTIGSNPAGFQPPKGRGCSGQLLAIALVLGLVFVFVGGGFYYVVRDTQAEDDKGQAFIDALVVGDYDAAAGFTADPVQSDGAFSGECNAREDLDALQASGGEIVAEYDRARITTRQGAQRNGLGGQAYKGELRPVNDTELVTFDIFVVEAEDFAVCEFTLEVS